MWSQLALKALVSGAVIALASEVARRSPGWGGLIVSLPFVTLLSLAWLWRDTHDAARTADFLASSALYTISALPAFALMVLLMRRQAGLPATLLAGALAAMAGYGVLMWVGRRWGLPV